MKTYQSIMHIQERQPSPVHGRIFSIWFEGCRNVFKDYVAVNSSEAISIKCAAQRLAFEHNQQHENKINLVIKMDLIEEMQ